MVPQRSLSSWAPVIIRRSLPLAKVLGQVSQLYSIIKVIDLPPAWQTEAWIVSGSETFLPSFLLMSSEPRKYQCVRSYWGRLVNPERILAFTC